MVKGRKRAADDGDNGMSVFTKLYNDLFTDKLQTTNLGSLYLLPPWQKRPAALTKVLCRPQTLPAMMRRSLHLHLSG